MRGGLLLTALCAVLVAPASAAEPEISAALSVMGYGHSVKVLVNGADIGITGGKSQAMRLFNQGHPWGAKASPAQRARNFVLKPGENELVIEFTREPKATDRLSIELQAEGYPGPLLDLTSTSRAAGKHVLKLRIEAKAPGDFKPVIITDAMPIK
jgi:hypothetical protein